MPIRCINCGQGNLEQKTVQLPGTVKGETYTVEMPGLECPKCGYKTIEGPTMPEYGRLLADKYRAAHGLLTSEEIRARRNRLGMNQRRFADYLGVGVASVKRWEMGKIQDPDSNRRIVEKTESPVYNLMDWALRFTPILNSTLGFYCPAYYALAAEQSDVLSLVDFTGLHYRQPRYSNETTYPRRVRILVDREDSFHSCQTPTSQPQPSQKS